MISIKPVLKLLKLEDYENGRYENNFYIIDLADSNEYSVLYTRLSDEAVNTEYPNFGTNTNNTTVKITNYFEIDSDNVSYNIFLIADFDNDKYYIKIGEK